MLEYNIWKLGVIGVINMDVMSFALPFLIVKLIISGIGVYVMILIIKALRKYLKDNDN